MSACKLTPRLQEVICKYVESGATLPHACAAAGISWNTCKEWAKPHMVDHEPFASFAAAVEQAKAKWSADAAVKINDHGSNDWKALAWMLERRNPDDYSVRDRLELTGANGGAIKMDTYAEMSDAQLLAIVAGPVVRSLGAGESDDD